MITATMENFRAQVLENPGPVLVEFWAAWCPYCRRLAPVMAELERRIGKTVKICGVNEDDEPELEDEYGVELVPTLILFRGGRPGRSLVAPGTMSQVENWLRGEGI